MLLAPESLPVFEIWDYSPCTHFDIAFIIDCVTQIR